MVPTYGELGAGGQWRSLHGLGGNEMELDRVDEIGESTNSTTEQQLPDSTTDPDSAAYGI